MLVIISDLHLTDGTTGTTIGAGAFKDFHDRLEELAFDASHRDEEHYEPITSLDLVLLGDVFDLVRTIQWSQGDGVRVRPWDDWNDPAFSAKIEEITDDILAYNAESLATLKAFSQGRGVSVPVDPNVPLGERVPVEVRTHYVVGNHDWYYHLPGQAYDAIRQKIGDAMGLCHGPEPYPHDPIESAKLMETYRHHRLFARHGDIYDPFNYVEEVGRNVATLGDAIVVELIARFPYEVQEQMADLPEPFHKGLAELSNVRPSVMVPLWVHSLLENSGLKEGQADAVKALWNGLADNFLEEPFVRAQDKRFRLDIVDLLQVSLRLTKHLPFDDIARLATLVWKKGSQSFTSFARHALKEDAYESGSVDHVVYGHTHHYEVVPLQRRYDGGRPVNRMYFNSGTWHSIHELTIQDRMKQEFANFQVMTYLAFFRDDERKGRRFETWSGTLGVGRSKANERPPGAGT